MHINYMYIPQLSFRSPVRPICRTTNSHTRSCTSSYRSYTPPFSVKAFIQRKPPVIQAPLQGCLAAINNSTKETRSWAPRGNPYACSSLPSGDSAPLVALKALYIDARIRFEAESFALMGFHYRYQEICPTSQCLGCEQSFRCFSLQRCQWIYDRHSLEQSKVVQISFCSVIQE